MKTKVVNRVFGDHADHVFLVTENGILEFGVTLAEADALIGEIIESDDFGGIGGAQ